MLTYGLPVVYAPILIYYILGAIPSGCSGVYLSL